MLLALQNRMPCKCWPQNFVNSMHMWVCVTETWFNEQMSSNYLDIDGYSLYRRDHKKRKGGSVCIYVKDILLSCVYYSSSDFEVIWVKVCCHGYCFFIAACYHPPNPKYNPFDFVNQLRGTIKLIINQGTVQFLLLLVILIYCVLIF